MKKIALFFVPFLLLTSCEASRSNVRSGTNTSTTEDSERPTTNSSSTTIPYSTESKPSSTNQPLPDGIKGAIKFWHHYGGGSRDLLNKDIIQPIYDDNKIMIDTSPTISGMDHLNEWIISSIAPGRWPNLATGYASHFHQYRFSGYPHSQTGILFNFDELLAQPSFNEEHINTFGYSIKDDYYPNYLTENKCSYDWETDEPITVGLPFASSSEVLVYNGVFFDYVKSHNPAIKVPETWEEWKTYGPIFREWLQLLIGKYLEYEITNDGCATNFHVTEVRPTDSNQKYLDFHNFIDKHINTSVLSWGRTNLFLTLIKQYASNLASYTYENRHDYSTRYHGCFDFLGGDNKTKTFEAIQTFIDLVGDDDTFTFTHILEDSQDNYSLDAFKNNQTMFAVCNSAVLPYGFETNDLLPRIAPIPYKDSTSKYVLSTNTNITMFKPVQTSDYGKEEFSFESAIAMTTGDNAAQFAVDMGHFPVSKSAFSSSIYQDFINNDNLSTVSDKLKKECALLKINEYSDSLSCWEEFFAPSFIPPVVIKGVAEKLFEVIYDYIENGGDLEDLIRDRIYYSSDFLTYFDRFN